MAWSGSSLLVDTETRVISVVYGIHKIDDRMITLSVLRELHIVYDISARYSIRARETRSECRKDDQLMKGRSLGWVVDCGAITGVISH